MDHRKVTILFVLFCIIVPLIRNPSQTIKLTGMGECLYYALRFSDMGFIDQSTLKQWTFVEYINYTLTFQKPKLTNDTDPPKRIVDEHRVPYKNQDVSHYLKVILKTIVKFLIFFGIVKHLRKSKPNWNPKPFEMTSWNSFENARDVYLLGLALEMFVDAWSTFLCHLASIAFCIPYLPLMNRPYLATSVRQFWSKKWNLLIHHSLRQSIFLPTLRVFGYAKPSSKEKVPLWCLMFGSLMTFAFSGLMHEWLIFVIFDTPSCGEQQVFFTLQGILCIMEVVVDNFILTYFKINLSDSIPKPFQILYTTIIITLTGPLFMNPYIREGIYFKTGMA
ncbi:hypothetical protein BC833DRAFT_621591 [Globomyces pollinis-pini]|nr:hypothetical protein BC833DRAFT_621591 [Globomyces pollinis-pini]